MLNLNQLFPTVRNILFNNKLLLFLVFIAVFLRIYNVSDTLLFHYDQGYHGLPIKEIWDTKKFTLLGHKTDVEGIYHGPLFYYSMIPVYMISSWNPAGASTILALIDGLSIIFIYLTAKEIFNKKTGIIAATLYSFSYLIISQARWLSNVTLIPFFSSIFLFLMAKSNGKNVWYFALGSLALGIITQLNGAVGFFMMPVLAYLLLSFRKDLLKRKTNLLIFILFFLIPSLPLLLFDIRHNFLVSSSIIRLFSHGKNVTPVLPVVYDQLILIIDQLVKIFYYRIPILFLTLILFYWVGFRMDQKKVDKEYLWWKRITISLSLGILLLLLYQGINGFFMVGFFPFIVLSVGWLLQKDYKNNFLKFISLLLVTLFIVVNLYQWKGFLTPNFNLVPIGTANLITLKDRIKATDFMYEKAHGKPFKTVIYIIPYYQEEPWDYVFQWYGSKKFGYLPDDNSDKVFLIYEPDYDNEERLEDWLLEAEQYGEIKSVFKSNSLTVEERV